MTVPSDATTPVSPGGRHVGQPCRIERCRHRQVIDRSFDETTSGPCPAARAVPMPPPSSCTAGVRQARAGSKSAAWLRSGADPYVSRLVFERSAWPGRMIVPARDRDGEADHHSRLDGVPPESENGCGVAPADPRLIAPLFAGERTIGLCPRRENSFSRLSREHRAPEFVGIHEPRAGPVRAGVRQTALSTTL